MSDQNNDCEMNGENSQDYNGAGGDSKTSANGHNDGRDDDRKLFVGGLSWDTTEKELREHFGKYGEIESINVKTDPQTGRSRGFAFIVYAAADSIDKVTVEKEHVINHKKVDPKKAKARHGKIFVGGLTTEISDDEIKTFFSQFGNIVDVEMPFDKQKNQRKGFCFITFDSEQVVNELLKTPKQTISGKEVDVKKATPKPENMMMMPMGMMRGGSRGGMRGGGRLGRGGKPGYGQGWNQGYGYGQSGGYGYGYDSYSGAGYDYYGGYGGYPGYDSYAGYGNYDYGYDDYDDGFSNGNRSGHNTKGGSYGSGKTRGGGGGRQPRHQPY